VPTVGTHTWARLARRCKPSALHTCVLRRAYLYDTNIIFVPAAALTARQAVYGSGFSKRRLYVVWAGLTNNWLEFGGLRRRTRTPPAPRPLMRTPYEIQSKRWRKPHSERYISFANLRSDTEVNRLQQRRLILDAPSASYFLSSRYLLFLGRFSFEGAYISRDSISDTKIAARFSASRRLNPFRI
jgi:hypothetical protein